MPKGQYDRKAAAAKRAAKSTLGKTGVGKVVLAEAPRVKRKYTKRAIKEELKGEGASGNSAMRSLTQALGMDGLGELHSLANFLGTLTSIGLQGGSTVNVAALIKKTSKTLETKFEKLFPVEEIVVASIGNGHIERPVTALPVPEKFVIPPPPPAPSNPS